MNSRERVLTALAHREPDKVPFDFGGTFWTSINNTAYRNLRRYLGLPEVPSRISEMIQQLGVIDDDVQAKLGGDAGFVAPGSSMFYSASYQVRDEGTHWAYTDEWGIGWHMPKDGGLYYDMYIHPLAKAETVDDLKGFPWPDPLDAGRFVGLRGQAKAIHDAGKAVCLSSICSGITEIQAWTRGFEQYYMDLAANHPLTEYILDKALEIKLAYWERALAEVGPYVDIALEADDMAGQNTLLFSPVTYRKLVKPRHRELFGFIKKHAAVKTMIHSCGAIRPLIPDLIEVGVDILNPVQVAAAGMDSAGLKRDFGKDISFWGGGVDTQRVLGAGTPQQVRDDVKRRIHDFAPGGGWVFATIHNIQPNVPPEKIMAMWETLQEFGAYR